jgi:hypothetical protein
MILVPRVPAPLLLSIVPESLPAGRIACGHQISRFPQVAAAWPHLLFALWQHYTPPGNGDLDNAERAEKYLA